MMRSNRFSFGLLWLVLAVSLVPACDQRPNPSEQPAKQSGSAGTSSDRGETHPDQPTGKPQSGEVTQPGRTPSGR